MAAEVGKMRLNRTILWLSMALILVEIALSCTTPIDDLSITNDTVLCSGTYKINDGGTSGVLRFADNNIMLTCNDTILEGYGTGDAFGGGWNNNITVQGCHIKNYSRALYHSGENWKIRNNAFENFTGSTGITLTGVNTLVENNVFNGTTADTMISLRDANHTLIRDNIFDNIYRAIYLQGNSGDIGYISIEDNLFNEVSGWSISMYGDYYHVNVTRNKLFSTSFYGIQTSDNGGKGDILIWLNAFFSPVASRISDYTAEGTVQMNYSGMGNYWETITCTDSDGDYFCDSALDVDGTTGTDDTYDYYAYADWTEDCVIPYEGMVITEDTEICRGTYNYPDKESRGVIRMGAANKTLDCNSSIFLGNSTGTGLTMHHNNLTVNDCNFKKYQVAGDFGNLWSWNYSDFDGILYGVATDSDDNIFLGGFRGTGLGNRYYELWKKDKEGETLWRWEATDSITSEDRLKDVAVDKEGDVVAAGFNMGSGGNWEFRLYKLSSSGDVLLNWSFDVGTGSDAFEDVVTDSEDNIIAAGWDQGVSGSVTGFHVVKFTSDGTWLWNWTHSKSGSWHQLDGVDVDSRDNIYVAGTDNVPGDYQYDIVKLDPQGNRVWNWTMNPSSKDDSLYDIAVDNDDNVIAVGMDGTPVPVGDYALHVVKLNPVGGLIWEWSYNPTTSDNDALMGVDTDSDNNIIVTGLLNYTYQPVMIKFAPNGTLLEFKVYNFNPNYGYFSDVFVDNSNNPIFAGIFSDGTSYPYALKTSNDLSIDMGDMTLYRSSFSNSTYGLVGANFSGTGIVKNTTFAFNNFGVYLSETVLDMLIYHNNFTQNLYQAYSENSANQFNTTNGGAPEGNYWSDVFSVPLNISDSDSDGYGDTGSQYPYNSTNGGCVFGLTDHGPVACPDADGDGFYNSTAPAWCPGQYRDCDDNDPNMIVPRDDMVVAGDVRFCPGTYYINDSGMPGVVHFAGSVLNCSGTEIIGNNSGIGFVDTVSNAEMFNCTFSNYTTAGVVGGLWNASFTWHTGNDRPNSVSLDSSGNVYVAGYWQNGSFNDWGLLKYDSSGILLWNRSYSWSTNNDQAYSVFVDPFDNVYVAGNWYNISDSDWGLLKYDSSGTLLWNRSFKWGSGSDSVSSVTTDTLGNVYIAGYWQNGSFYDWGLVKYDSSGILLWNRSYSWSTNNDQAYSVATDASGNIYVVGMWYNTSNDDWGLLKYDSDGNYLWNRSYHWGDTDDSPHSVKLDSLGNIYIGGSWSDFGINDWAILKYDPSGNYLWSKSKYWSGFDGGESLTLDSFSNAYMTGYVYTGSQYVWGLTKYNSSGDLQFSKTFTLSNSDQAHSITTDSYGSLYIVGEWDNGSQKDWAILKVSSEGDVITENSTFYNNTFMYSMTGINLTEETDNNIFYYNNFTDNVDYQVYAENALNQFNTTNGVSGYAEGNWWSDIILPFVDIKDTNADTFGDSGDDYPYRLSTGGAVSSGVIDYGPQPAIGCYDTDGDGAYNTSSSAVCEGYRDCDDYNATLLPPRDDLLLLEDSWLCPGTYELNDSGYEGLVKLGGDITLECQGAQIIGNETGIGFTMLHTNATLNNCTASNYSLAVWVGGLWNYSHDESPSGDWFSGVDTDSEGNVIAGGADNNPGYRQMHVVKFDKEGNVLWNWTNDPGADSTIEDVVVDEYDNVYAAGYYVDTDGDFFIAKLDKDGNFLWNWTDDLSNSDLLSGVAIDLDGDIIAVGWDNVPGNSAHYLLKLNSLGAKSWNKTYNPTGSTDSLNDVVIDSENNIVVTGIKNIGGFDSFYVAKYDTDGNLLWEWENKSSSSSDDLYGISVDSYDNIFVAGQHGSNGGDFSLLKFDSSGNQLFNWTSTPSGSSDSLQSVVVDAKGDVFAGGYSDTGSSKQQHILKFNNTGTLLAEQTFDKTTGWDAINDIAVDSNNNPVIAGFINDYAIREFYAAKLDNNMQEVAVGILVNGSTFANSSIGIYASGLGEIGNITENNLFDNGYGVYINASGVKVFYNNFTGNSVLQAVATAGNHFNTTVSGYAQGNYWSDINNTWQLWDMYNADGFADAGLDWPYDDTNGSVNENVVDYGPMILEEPVCMVPYDGAVTTKNITLCEGTYYVNSTDYVLDLDADHLTVTCNGTVVIGNGTVGFSGLGITTTNDHVAVRDCTFVNYSIGFYNHGNFHQINTTISNSSFIDNAILGFYFFPFNTLYTGSNLSITGSTFSGGSGGLVVEALNDSIFINNTFKDSPAGLVFEGNNFNSTGNNITGNIFINNTYDLNFTADTTDNNIWLNHFHTYGVSDLAGTNNNYCIAGEGNFYEYQIPSSQFGHDDCGPLNISIPSPGNLYGAIIPITYSAQSTYLTPLLYYLEYSDDSGISWQDITTTTATTYNWNITNETLYPDDTDYQVRVIPYDGYVNGTYNWTGNFEINHTIPVTYDNVTTDDRYWYVDTSVDVRLWTETPAWNTTYWCNYSIYSPICTDFLGVEDNDATVVVDGFPNSVYQQYVRYWHNDSNGLQEYPHDSNQINIVYGSFINDTYLWNTTVSNGSTIIGSDINDSHIDGCYIENSTIINSNLTKITNCRVVNSLINNSNVTDSTLENVVCEGCNYLGSTVINTTPCGEFDFQYATVVDKILTAGRVDYLGLPYYPEVSTDRICEGLPVLNITYPIAGSVIEGNVDVLFDNPEQKNPQISIDGATWSNTDTMTSHKIDTSGYADGPITVQIRDTDQAGNYVYSNIVTYTIDNYNETITIIRPEDDTVMTDDTEVVAIAPEYISKVYFYLENETGQYDLTGIAGETEDDDSSDGWNATILADNLGPGTYNLTAKAYQRCYFITNCLNSTDTVYNLTIDRQAPTGTIEIIGSEGNTTQTSYRNVVLNTTFSDNLGTVECRYANEAESALASAPWEPCQSMKSWSLIDSYGTRTVWLSIKDVAGNMYNVSDSILYEYAPDSTPPTPPTVNDGLVTGTDGDVDWTNSNTTVSATWYGATEDMSTIMYKYKIYKNGTEMGGYVDVGIDTSMTNDSLSLVEGTNYSVEVVAYNPSGLNSSGYSDGAWTDFTDPLPPNVTSSTHPVEGTSYANSTVVLHFNSSDVNSSGVLSGVEGYSYSLDNYPGSAPDNEVDIRKYETLQEYLEGTDWEILYDQDSQTSFKALTTIEYKLQQDQKVKVRFALAELGSETDENIPITIGLTDEVCTGFSTCTFIGTNDTTLDVAYAYTVGNVDIYEAIITATSNVADTDFNVVLGIDGSHTGTRNISIPFSDTTNFRTNRCEEGGSCVQNLTKRYAMAVELLDETNTTQTVQYDNLADGTYYFHVKAKDNAGNWGNTTHFQIDVAAGTTSMAIESPTNGQLFLLENQSAESLNISAKVFVSDNTDLKLVSLHGDGSTTNSSTKTVSVSGRFNVTLELGTNELYAESTTGVRSSSVFVILARDITGSLNKSLVVRHSSCTNTDSNLCYFSAGGVAAGIASEEGTAASGVVAAETEHNTIKIFATDPAGFDAGRVNTKIADDEFLDEIQPLFGFDKGVSKYVISDSLRYEDIYVSGEQKVAPGKYNLIILHNGVTPDGRVNVTIAIQ